MTSSGAIQRHRRLRVVATGAATCVAVTAAFAVLGGGHALLFVLPLAGPFAALTGAGAGIVGVCASGSSLLLAIGAHPAHPRPRTACITVLAVGWWLLDGLTVTYAGV